MIWEMHPDWHDSACYAAGQWWWIGSWIRPERWTVATDWGLRGDEPKPKNVPQKQTRYGARARDCWSVIVREKEYSGCYWHATLGIARRHH